MKQFWGTCVNNPFSTVDHLIDVVDNGHEISRQTFLKHCDIPEELSTRMRRFPDGVSNKRW